MTVFVTGASGFVGRGLVPRLLAGGARVRMAVREPDFLRPVEPLPPGAERFVLGDLAALPDLRLAMAGVKAVVHLAARVHLMRDAAADPLAAYRAMNVEATLHLARAAADAGVRRFVFLSSVKALGESGTFREDDLPQSSLRDPYGISKREAEDALRALGRERGLEVAIVRSPLVYGPGVGANFAALLRVVERGVPLPFARVRNRRSLVARTNLADLLAVATEHPAAAGETFGVSDGEDLSTPDLIRRLARALGRPARLLPVPVVLLRALATVVGRRDAADRLLGSLTLDITKARTRLGWRPPVSVDEALRETALAWRAEQGEARR